MEAAICTRCQSTNPLFTKFCLICGLEITPQMKRTLSPPGNKPVMTKILESPKEEEKEQAVEVSVQEPVVETSAAPKETTSLWGRLLGRT